MSQWNLGSFSNLGDWDSEKTITQSDCEGAWMFAPPVLRCQMVGAGCLTFQNPFSLLIQTHPDLTTSSAGSPGWGPSRGQKNQNCLRGHPPSTRRRQFVTAY